MTGSRSSPPCRSAQNGDGLVCTPVFIRRTFSAAILRLFSATFCVTFGGMSSSSGITPEFTAANQYGIYAVDTTVSTSRPCRPTLRNSIPLKQHGGTPKACWPTADPTTKANSSRIWWRPSRRFLALSDTYGDSFANRIFPLFCDECCVINAEVNRNSSHPPTQVDFRLSAQPSSTRDACPANVSGRFCGVAVPAAGWVGGDPSHLQSAKGRDKLVVFRIAANSSASDRAG